MNFANVLEKYSFLNFVFYLKNDTSILRQYEVLRRYLKTEWAKETTNVKFNASFGRISLQNGVNFRKFKGCIQSEQGKNIDTQFIIGLYQSICHIIGH